MKLKVLRDSPGPKDTIGVLSLDSINCGFSLELPVIDGKPGSAIPAGIYRVIAAFSPHFGRLMPLIEVGQGRSHILIHPGHTVLATEGCVTVGETRDVNTREIFGTVKKFDELWPAIEEAAGRNDCWIEIADLAPPNSAQDVMDIGQGGV